MPEAESNLHLRPALRAVLDLLRENGTPGAVIGGLAVSAHAQPRMTRDVDVLTLLRFEGLDAFLSVARKHGFESRHADPSRLAREVRMVLLRHAPSGVTVDISLGCTPFDEEAVRNAVHRQIAGIPTPIVTPEDLIITKAVAHRPIDAGDIDMVLTAHPEANVRRVRRIVKDYAALLEDPEVVADLEKILARHKRAKRRKPKGG